MLATKLLRKDRLVFIAGNDGIEPECSVSLFEERSQKHRKKIDR